MNESLIVTHTQIHKSVQIPIASAAFAAAVTDAGGSMLHTPWILVTLGCLHIVVVPRLCGRQAYRAFFFCHSVFICELTIADNGRRDGMESQKQTIHCIVADNG